MSTLTSTTLPSMLRGPATVVWFVLIAATALSWMLGTNHGMPSDHSVSSVLILCVAFIKVRLIGLWFMELRDAPPVLRGLFETYCVVMCSLLVCLYLVL
jgi:hypothetical protein